MTNEQQKDKNAKEFARLMGNVLSDCEICPICDFCEDTRSNSNRFLYCKDVCERWLKREVEE